MVRHHISTLALQQVTSELKKIFKMKFAIVFAALFAVAFAGVVPNNPDAVATIVSQSSDIDPQGNFNFA